MFEGEEFERLPSLVVKETEQVFQGCQRNFSLKQKAGLGELNSRDLLKGLL